MAESLKTGFHHVALRVPNFDEALAFYTKALGLTVRARWEGQPFCSCPTVVIWSSLPELSPSPKPIMGIITWPIV